MSYSGQKIKTLDELSKALGFSISELFYLAKNSKNLYRIKQEPKKDGTVRTVFSPHPKLKAVQRAILAHLCQKYELPDYIYGLNGKSIKVHAARHVGNKDLIKMDIRDFFPSIPYAKVYSIWVHNFGFSPDVARVLTMLTSHRGAAQQGLPTSSYISAIASLPVTEAINNYCKSQKVVFTQYIDDFNFSGGMDKQEVIQLVVNAARSQGFSMKRKKTKVSPGNIGKEITGVSVFGRRLRATKQLRQAAVRSIKEGRLKSANGYIAHLGFLNKKDKQKFKELNRKLNKQ